MIKPEYKYSEITERIIGCAVKVQSKMGNGYREVIYQRCLALEFEKEGLLFQREFEANVYYGENIVENEELIFLCRM